MWNSIVSVPDHCLLIYFASVLSPGSLALLPHSGTDFDCYTGATTIQDQRTDRKLTLITTGSIFYRMMI